MDYSTEKVATAVKVMAAVWTLWMVMFLKYLFVKPKPISLALRLRRKLVSRIKQRLGAPRLCGYHVGAMMRPGQMAILDSAKCELCDDETRSKKYVQK